MSAMTAAEATRMLEVKEPAMLSRLLYPNPVCVLGVAGSAGSPPAFMTISWLTATDNRGGFVCSISQRRHTGTRLKRRLDCDGTARMTLSVAVAGMEPLLLAIGSTSGFVVDKRRELGIPLCRPGGEVDASPSPSIVTSAGDPFNARVTECSEVLQSVNRELHDCGVRIDAVHRRVRALSFRLGMMAKGDEPTDREALAEGTQRWWPSPRVIGHRDWLDEGDVAVPAACAHIVCEVDAMTARDGHWLTTGTILRGYVKKGEFR